MREGPSLLGPLEGPSIDEKIPLDAEGLVIDVAHAVDRPVLPVLAVAGYRIVEHVAFRAHLLKQHLRVERRAPESPLSVAT